MIAIFTQSWTSIKFDTCKSGQTGTNINDFNSCQVNILNHSRQVTLKTLSSAGVTADRWIGITGYVDDSGLDTYELAQADIVCLPIAS